MTKLLHGDPAPSTSRIIVACPTCGWWEQSDRVRRGCPECAGHPVPVSVRVECTEGCDAGWYRTLPEGCSGGPDHRLQVTEFERV